MPVTAPTFVTDLQLDCFFEIEIVGFGTFGCVSVDGLDQVIGVHEYKEGGENTFTHRLPDRVKYNNLVLKKGVIAEKITATPPNFQSTASTIANNLFGIPGGPSTLLAWFENAINFLDFNPRTVRVTLFGAIADPTDPTVNAPLKLEPIRRWEFINAWPNTWKVSQLNSHFDDSHASVLFDTIEFTYQYFYRIPVT